jgi:hypothetical protein
VAVLALIAVNASSRQMVRDRVASRIGSRLRVLEVNGTTALLRPGPRVVIDATFVDRGRAGTCFRWDGSFSISAYGTMSREVDAERAVLERPV